MVVCLGALPRCGKLAQRVRRAKLRQQADDLEFELALGFVVSLVKNRKNPARPSLQSVMIMRVLTATLPNPDWKKRPSPDH